MGRNKTPDAMKIARGTDKPSRMTGDLGVPVLDFVSPPKFLTGDAKKIFEQTARQLCACRVLTALDVEQLAMYAMNLGKAVEAEKKIKKEGAVIKVKTKFGEMQIVSPWMKVQKDAMSMAAALAQQFGLTPVSRIRIAQMVPPAKKDEDPFAEYED